MPVVKPISGHTGCFGIMRYLTKGGRALACDLVNLDWSPEHPCGYRDWADEMDFTRVAYGNHTAWRGRPARTYKHYVVSPDPTDGVTLDAMRDLAQAWVAENFDGFQAAIVYHDDNESGVMHAHVVVNNTHLGTGRRLQDPDPKALMRSVQRLAEERGMSFFSDEDREDVARVAFGGAPHVGERVHFRRAEKELAEKGEYSWVADIRARVGLARRVAADEADFLGVLHGLGVEVADASTRGGVPDWVYSLAGHETWRIRGANLGTAYSQRVVLEGLELRSPSPRDAALCRIFEAAVEVGDLEDLDRLATTLEANEREGIRCIDDYDARIAALTDAGDECGAAALAEARDYSIGKGLLPQRAQRRGHRKIAADPMAATLRRDGGSRAQDQDQQRQRDRQRRQRGR